MPSSSNLTSCGATKQVPGYRGSEHTLAEHVCIEDGPHPRHRCGWCGVYWPKEPAPKIPGADDLARLAQSVTPEQREAALRQLLPPLDALASLVREFVDCATFDVEFDFNLWLQDFRDALARVRAAENTAEQQQ